MISAENDAVPPELLAMAERVAAPQLRKTALDQRFGPRSSWVPAAGQLWRAVSGDVTALVLLVAIDVESVTVVPASVGGGREVAAADAVEVEDTVLGVPVTFWTGLRCALPVGVLDRPVDDLGAALLSRIAELEPATASANAAFFVDDVRTELADDLELLAASAIDTAAGPADVAGAAAAIDLDAVDPADLDEAASRLEVSLPVVLDLIDGKRPPTAHQADVLREVLGAAPAAALPAPALLVELSQPRWRSLVRQHRRRGGLSETAARTALAYDIGAMAARQTGGREPSWSDRVRLWAQGQQLNPDADA